MKKLIALGLVSLLAATATFARSKSRGNETVVHAFDIAIPFDNKTWKLDDDDVPDAEIDTGFVGFGVNYNKMSVKNSGFTKIFGLGFGYTSATIDDYFDVDLGGFDTYLKFGWGYAPLKTDKMILGIHGFIGGDLKILDGDAHNVDFTVTDFAFLTGVDALFAFKLTNSFGLNGGLDLSTNVFGAGALKVKNNGTDRESTDSFTYAFSGVNVALRFGICLIF